MSLTVNTKSYIKDGTTQNYGLYTGPAKTMTVKDDIKLARIKPTPVVTSSGVATSSLKLTRTLTLTGALEPVRDAIIDISQRIPVGAASADIDVICNDLGAYIASAEYKSIVKAQRIDV